MLTQRRAQLAFLLLNNWVILFYIASYLHEKIIMSRKLIALAVLKSMQMTNSEERTCGELEKKDT